MPWSDTSPMDQRTPFIADYLRDMLSITELCPRYGVSRKTVYKWIDRYLRFGPVGLEARSRRPRHSPTVTAPEIVAALLDAHRRHPAWGAPRGCSRSCTSATPGGRCRAAPPSATS